MTSKPRNSLTLRGAEERPNEQRPCFVTCKKAVHATAMPMRVSLLRYAEAATSQWGTAAACLQPWRRGRSDRWRSCAERNHEAEPGRLRLRTSDKGRDKVFLNALIHGFGSRRSTPSPGEHLHKFGAHRGPLMNSLGIAALATATSPGARGNLGVEGQYCRSARHA